ncbi:hypothetical protein F444_15687 [Phytophthora nicotianae P1976]|uniref:Uncharacterized protein n=1 Tax=Phytophthora nicotianae P1976 TaxID=1317066 RepID=A0A080ZL79_PHYNI|nr:hypothetical protein F444_15687 [Phytophthora nicotianae P1976]
MSDQRCIKEGWLQKRSRPGKLVGNWRRRYFRLTSTELAYYKSPQDVAPRRRYELTLDSSVLRTNDQGYSNCIAFQAAPGQPSFYMLADNEDEKEEWTTAIYNAYRRTPDVAQQPPAPEIPKATPESTPPQPPPPPAPPSRILLKLVVEEARKLKAADMNGKSDPYCIVKLIGKDGKTIEVEEKRTDVISATLEPVWKASFEIGRVVDLNSVKAVRFDLMDHDTLQRHDSLGTVEVPFSRFRMSSASTVQSEPIDEWFRVNPPKKTGLSSSFREKEHVVKDWGELHVKMSITGPNLVDFFHNSELEFVPTSPVATATKEHTDNRLEVTVLAARNLISVDANDSSDPYCELTLLDDNGRPISSEYATTATMHRTRNPTWANEHHVFGLICPIETAASLKVRVVDYDKTNRNDPLGFAIIHLEQLSAHKWTEWHALQPEEGMSNRANLGEIQLKIWLIGERRGEHARRLKIDKELHLKAHSQSVEQLEYENAQIEMYDAACKLDGARIPCAVTDYQARDPRFYGINGCIHYLNSQIPRAHQEKTSTDESFQARTGLEGQALLEVTVIQASDLKQNQKAGDKPSTATPYAVIELDPSVCVEECKRTSSPLSPKKSKRVAAGEARNTMFSKRAQGEVSMHRTKLAKNEMRSESPLEINPDILVLKVEIRTGHGLSPADMNGYSDPYCTLSLTDRTTGKAIEAEKKRTAVMSKTLNPVWTNEIFVFGNNVPLLDARSLLVHVKDHNNIGRSTPLGRVEIPLSDLCRESVDSTSISSTEVVKRYELKPEPWMKKSAKELGELCIKTEFVGNTTALAELVQRMSSAPIENSSSSSEAKIQSEASIDTNMSMLDLDESEFEDEKTEIIQLGAPIKTSTSKILGTNSTATWDKEKFLLSLSYPGLFSDAKYPNMDTQLLQLRVHEARNLLISAAAGDRSNTGPSATERDAVEGPTNSKAQNPTQRQRNATNVYFTVVPVRRDGTLEDAERIQSLTVYNARDPSWPVQEFVFGKVKDIANVSYLSLHMYERDVESDQESVLSNLLTDKEKKLDVCLKRFQLHKLSSSGEVEDDDFELLQFGQRVLAFRGGEDGGRFYPACIQRYIPFPDDEYEVRFDDEINTIDELRNLISLDVKGVVQAERSDGRLDVAVDNESTNSVKRSSRYVVKPSQLVPVNSLTGSVERLMARRLDVVKEENERWARMQHMVSGIVVDVLSASDLVVPVIKDGKLQKMKHLDKNDNLECRVTLLGKPRQKEPNLCYFNDRGELFTSETMSQSTWKWEKDKQLEATIGAQNETNDNESGASEKDNSVLLFQNQPLVIGRVEKISPTDAKETKVEYRYQPVDPNEAKVGCQILEQTSSILIQVNAQVKVENQDETGSKKNLKKEIHVKESRLLNVTLGYAKIDLAMLRSKQQTLRLQIVPLKSANVPYFKSVGSLFVRISTSSDDCKMKTVRALVKAEDPEHPRLFELSSWYEKQLQLEAVSSSLFTRGVTWIERRQLLRTSLSPTENAQIDALHTVLVIVMKRIVNILREIQQFEAFEALCVDEMRMSRLVHTVNADPGSEYLGRTMDKLPHEVRKEIVVGLENELLDLAGVSGPRIYPAVDTSREEWMRLRTERQKLLQEYGNFFMRDQTSALVVSVPKSFTGEGIIAWFRRRPSVLWDDKWEVYCNDAAIISSCKLGWRSQSLEYDPDALQAPTDDVHVLQWMSALCAAGYVENVTPGIGFGKRRVLLECRDDYFYRLREVDMWMENLSRESSLFPLDLVQEIDCYQEKSLEQNNAGTENEQTQTTTKETRSYAKKLTEYCDGFLGMHTMLSSVLFAVKDLKNALMPPVVEKPSDNTGNTEKGSVASAEEQGTVQVVESILWDWKYCLFMPSRKHVYIYENETSTAPVAFIDMASAVCKVAYNFSNDVKGGWMDIVNPTVYVRKPNSREFESVTPEILNKMTKPRANGDKVIEVKTSSTQKWIQALARSGVCVDMRPGQEVLMKRLNPIILQQKCNKHATEFDPNDLEGSFQRLLNRLFGHDKGLTYQDHETERRELRAQVRSELKKAGNEGDTVMAYYGKGKNRRSKPMNSGNFKNDSLYPGRILRIRTPFTDEKYPFKTTYDMTDTNEVPTELAKLLAKYKVVDKTSWLSLPKSQRDMFLLYVVEYSHANERIVEEGLMREHIRTNEGDLDPQKVSDKCADLNILFKATDLENCVSRMVKHRYRHKSLGVLKIHTKMISPHRTIDAWYPLAPASDMLQRTNLGQVRVELKLVQKREVTRSAKLPPIPENVRTDELTPQDQGKSTVSQATDSKGRLPFAVGREPSFVKVSILEGRSLPVADMFTSDSFVEIILLDENSKERDTSLKTDIKMKTLNPKWENQEFLLGKTEKTKLSDKKGILLRVMDYDAASANDPLGCVTIEFQRREGYIRGLVLKQADAYGNADTRDLKLEDHSRVEVEAMLLPISGKPKPKKTPAPDGVLGKLRFVVEIIRNDSSVNVIEKRIEKRLEATTSYSAEMAIKKAIKNTGAQEDWSKYSCYFQPRGEAGARVKCDSASEDLGFGNSYKLSDLLSSTASLSSSGKATQASSSIYAGAFKILGRTYDLSKVDYFDVRLASESTGKTFEGQLGKSDQTTKDLEGKHKFSLKTPNQCASFRDETVVLTERDSKETLTLTFDLNLIGILRADRVRRLLADTFRLVGLAFDSRTFNHTGGRYNLEQLHKDVEMFLWENSQANLIPGRNVAEELLTQLRIMSQASKLHWKATPQLLGYVFELVLLSGDNDRLSYASAVALDAVLNRWSRVLVQVTEAREYLTGNFHGKKTPRLIEALFTECEWTGFNVMALSDGDNGTTTNKQRLSPFSIDDRVTVRLPFLKHAGVVVDTQLHEGRFVAARIVKECGAGLFNVKICDVLGNEVTLGDAQERVGKLKEYDNAKHPEAPYLVEYLDGLEPRVEWRTHRLMSEIVLQVEGELLKSELEPGDFVHISEEHIVLSAELTTDVSRVDDNTDTSSTIITGKTRPGKITNRHGGARYDVVFTDGLVPVNAKVVNRSRLIPMCNETMYDGRITSIYAPVAVLEGPPPPIKYTVCLENGEVVHNFSGTQIRPRHGVFAADTAFLGAVFSSNLPTLDKNRHVPDSTLNMAKSLEKLWWGSDKILKVYAMLPAAVKSIQVRNATTNKLLQTALLERNENEPRFIGQYHGFVKGETLDEKEAYQLELVHNAVCKRRQHNGSLKMAPQFSKEKCFYLIVASPPLVQIRGQVRVCSSPYSEALFKGLVMATLGSTPDLAVTVVQRLLRAECSKIPRAGSKECRVAIKCAKVEFAKNPTRDVVLNLMHPSSKKAAIDADLAGVSWLDACIDIKFQLSVPYNDQGNISEAVATAYENASTISKRLQTFNTLAVEVNMLAPDTVDMEKLSWLLTTSDINLKSSMALSIDFSSQTGRSDLKPEVSLEPLDDIRVSVRDSHDKTHDLHFRIDDILAEAAVRRNLTPFHKAIVVAPPSENESMRCRVRFLPTSSNKSNAGADVENKRTGEVDVPTGSIRFDKLRVKVVEASNMKFKEKMGNEGLQVEVMLVSSDFDKHMTVSSGKKTTTPFGLEVSSTGELLPDIYPKNSSFTLMYDTTQVVKQTSDASVAWRVKNGPPYVEFKYPVIDMDRVSEVRLVIRDKKTQAKMGIVTIPMGSISISRSVEDIDKPKDEPIYSMQRDGADGKRAVVGTLSLSVERIQKYSANDEVYAKHLEKPMDFWTICPKELLKLTLEQHESKLSRSFLAAGPPVSGEGKILLSTAIDMELQLQKIAKVQRIDAITKLQSSTSSRSVALLSSSNEFQNFENLKSRAMDTLQQTLQQTKSFMKDTAHELGLGHYMTEHRLPWSSDTQVDKHESQLRDDVVVVEANVATCTNRVQLSVLKLHEVLTKHFIPKLDELYTLDADDDRVDITKGESLLSFFDTEVEELEPEDEKVRLKLYQRLRLTKLIQVLDLIMKASVRVKVMNEDRNNVDGYIGTACIPLMDLLDQQPHDDVYELLYLPTTNLRGSRIAVEARGANDSGKLRLRLHLKISESSFFEQAIEVYKVWKAKYIAQHEAARRRIHDAVVPAQRRRWTTVKGYLDELTAQTSGKLHWERTPVLLSLVWDIFTIQESTSAQSKKKSDADEAEHSHSIAKMADNYRGAVMKVHQRWVNLQPKLDELLIIQATTQIHAHRTPDILEDIEKEIEGLDVGLSTAWKQVKQKWQTLLEALEELVRMNEGKLNLARAPQLLSTVEQRCSKGLNTRHSDAVSQIQSRWMAITQPNGPLSELRLMEKKGLHWRRTHELLLLLDEQCEGFADVDARALNTVQTRWEQVQEWLHEVVQMQLQHSIDSEHTPFILEKMQLWKPTRGKKQEENKLERSRSASGVAPSSPSAKDNTASRQPGLSRQYSVSSDGGFTSGSGIEDNGQLEGMAEWYAIEEAKYELERIPYHRITMDSDKKNWLPFSRDGKDSRLLITQEEMFFTPANVRLALEDRGVIPKTSTFDLTADSTSNASAKEDVWVKPSLLDSKSGSQTVVLPKHVDEEIKRLEKVLESQRENSQQLTLPNPERVAELYQAMESLGKTELLRNVSHAVSRNLELAVQENYQLLLREMTSRQISTTEVENLVESLAITLRKETLVAKGITVPDTVDPTTLRQLMEEHEIREVALPQDTSSIQTLLDERGMDHKGEPVMLRGVRIGTQSTQTGNTKAINTGLGIIDTQVETLRRTLLFEALRKRNSLVRSFAGESHVLDEETERTEADMFAAAIENAEVDVSGDYLTLVERFQRLLVHESYTKRLAEYAALDRCMRALLGKSRDEVVTKEEIAMELHNVNKRVIGANYRLPPEAFTREELFQAVAAGRIRTPSDEMLSHCPEGENASAMAHYAAISYAANVFQEVTSFRSRVDVVKNRLQDTFPYDECSSLDGVFLQKQRTRQTLSQSIADWLLGFDASALSIKRKLSAAHRQRLEWASAAFTLRNRWLQRGLGWCDHEFEGVGVKYLLDRLLLFEAANKMDMVKTEKLLREVRDKCSRLRDREQEAQTKLEERYQANLALLEKLVTHAERCMNNRKLHSEETPVLLHKLEQVCVVPKGLNDRHREAYHTVATHWLPHQQHLAELVKMHREGTFSITRTPELLGKMQYHTEGKAGSEELSEDKVAASAQRVAPELQATFVDRKLNEVRLGQRKEPSSLHLNLNTEENVDQSADDTEWKELSPSKRVVQPLSPHEKQTSWKVVRNAVAANAAFSAASPSKTKPEKAKVEIAPKVAPPPSPRRRLSLSDELKELLRSPTQWFTGTGQQEEYIRAELYFPEQLVLDTASDLLSDPTK